MGTPAFAGGIDLLSLLGSAKQKQVLEGSTRAGYRAGTVAFRPGHPARAFLVAEGLARVYMSVRYGREATVAFVHPGTLVGARNLVRGITVSNDPPLTSVQAVIDSIFRFSTSRICASWRRLISRCSAPSRRTSLSEFTTTSG